MTRHRALAGTLASLPTAIVPTLMLGQLLWALAANQSSRIWGLLQVEMIDNGTQLKVDLGLDLGQSALLWLALTLCFGALALVVWRRK